MKRISLLLLFSTTLILNIYSESNWSQSMSEDEMTGEKKIYILSAPQPSTKPMSFPYEGTKATLAIGMDKENTWLYMHFSDAPNLLDTEIKDGYNKISTRVKYGDNLESISLTQDWGSQFIHFEDDYTILRKLSESDKFLIELNWYGCGNVYFKFPTEGLSEMILSAKYDLLKKN